MFLVSICRLGILGCFCNTEIPRSLRGSGTPAPAGSFTVKIQPKRKFCARCQRTPPKTFGAGTSVRLIPFWQWAKS